MRGAFYEGSMPITLVHYAPRQNGMPIKGGIFSTTPKTFLGFIVPSSSNYGSIATLEFTIKKDIKNETVSLTNLLMGENSSSIAEDLAQLITDASKKEIHIIQFDCKSEDFEQRLRTEDLFDIIKAGIKDVVIRSSSIIPAPKTVTPVQESGITASSMLCKA